MSDPQHACLAIFLGAMPIASLAALGNICGRVIGGAASPADLVETLQVLAGHAGRIAAMVPALIPPQLPPSSRKRSGHEPTPQPLRRPPRPSRFSGTCEPRPRLARPRRRCRRQSLAPAHPVFNDPADRDCFADELMRATRGWACPRRRSTPATSPPSRRRRALLPAGSRPAPCPMPPSEPPWRAHAHRSRAAKLGSRSAGKTLPRVSPAPS